VSSEAALLSYVLRLGDNALITAQRMIERVTGEPELEEELANANFALDYIGQARMFYSYAGELEGNGRAEDDFAYLRDAEEFRNFLLVEQPNGHFGESIVRQVLFETFYLLQLQALMSCGDQRLADIAARAEKEIRYHLRHARKWLVRLGDGTEESHERVQQALVQLWRYKTEFFEAASFDGPDLTQLEQEWNKQIAAVLDEATLSVPEIQPMATDEQAGQHGEHFDFLIAEMQHLQRTFPGATW